MGAPFDNPARREPERPPVQVGDVLADKYVVERVLGIGGMGLVVAARHRELNELRAVKLMRRDALAESGAVERFLREARAAVRLKSQHAVKVHDVGRLETGEPYMVMEYLDGTDLKWILRSRGVLPVVETVDLVLQAVEAIAEAHAAGIVHRDLKPGNLFVTTTLDGGPFVKVLDFGISKVTAGEGAGFDMTKTSSMLGTPYYMSPEQMRSSRKVDVRTDVWALGVILYQLLTGRVPFKEDTITALCVSVIQDDPVPPRQRRPEIPPELEAVVMCCLQKKPSGRYSSVADLAAALVPFGPPDARVRAARIGRLIGRGPALSPATHSAIQSGSFVPFGPDAAREELDQLAPTTPLRAPAVADSAATAASWGRTGPLERGRLAPTVKAAIAGVLVAALALITVLVLVLTGPSEQEGSAEEQAGRAATGPVATGGRPLVSATAASAGAETSTATARTGGEGGASGDDDGAIDGRAGGEASVRRPVVRSPPPRRPRPTPKPEPEPTPDDPFGDGRK